MENFHTPLSTQAYQRLLELHGITQGVQRCDNYDKWVYPWGSNFSSIKMYKMLKQGEPASPIFARICRNATMLRYKIFLWLLLHDRNLLHKEGFHLPSYNCELCHSHTEETSLHVFWDCNFAFSCCESILGHRNRGISLYDEITLLAQALPASIAMEILIMGCWNIWNQRTGTIFRS